MLVLGIECLVWLCIWHKPQVTKIPCCTGVMVSASSGNMYRHMVLALWFTYHLSSVSNLHLILGSLLLFVRLDVGPWPWAPSTWRCSWPLVSSPWPWPWLSVLVVVNITAVGPTKVARSRAGRVAVVSQLWPYLKGNWQNNCLTEKKENVVVWQINWISMTPGLQWRWWRRFSL